MSAKNGFLTQTFDSVMHCIGKPYLTHFVSFLQEYMAVTFQLVCLSRLGATPIVSTLVLLLTLIVFTGPLLNTWLMIANHACVQHNFFGNIPLILLIMLAQAAGTASAYGIVEAFASKSLETQAKSVDTQLIWMTPVKIKEGEGAVTDWKLWNHFFDELFAVTSLLIGCVYLLWLAHLKKEKRDSKRESRKAGQEEESDIPWIDMRFYLHLTLLVAAVSQAFPSAHMSPHISGYLLSTKQIDKEVFGIRFGAGVVACILTRIWSSMRLAYRQEIQHDLPSEYDHSTKKKQVIKAPAKSLVEMHTPHYTRIPAVRLSVQGASYF
jgi:hypothetical protein